jgi:gliding motility-associated-like protein
VPTASTPNGDGKNDIFKPIALGMKSVTYFKIFNRFGQLIFDGNPNIGWDGTFKGKPLDPDIFVWIVEGIDFENHKISKQGSVMLIR